MLALVWSTEVKMSGLPLLPAGELNSQLSLLGPSTGLSLHRLSLFLFSDTAGPILLGYWQPADF